MVELHQYPAGFQLLVACNVMSYQIARHNLRRCGDSDDDAAAVDVMLLMLLLYVIMMIMMIIISLTLLLISANCISPFFVQRKHTKSDVPTCNI